MKQKYKHIRFVEIPNRPEAAVYDCINNTSGDPIGRVEWYPAWRQYCFFPGMYSVYSLGCLNDIADFMQQLKELI